MTHRSQKRFNFILEIVIAILALLFLYPLFLVVFNSFKTYEQVLTNILALPKTLMFDNYQAVWGLMGYPKLFVNTFLLTLLSVTGIVIFGSMAGYKLSRTKSRLSTVLFFLAISPMMIPFQSFMITLTKLAKTFHLINSLGGLGIIYWGLGAPLAVFMFHGFVKSLPIELEESGAIDGASRYGVFVRIVFPVMVPVISTVIILNVMWIWNDFLLPLLMLNGKQATLQLASYKFFGQYKSEWQYALTAVVYTSIPPIAVFLFLQKYIIKGMVAGAVKG
ncbi:carbohydrate ABC transporter permease [Paenibacillus sp. CF384]|uniref:carbohydrate ABC transporter permease n=1 Tax=Paenibacillus sp. CF384 TaxID=1884382 RepID=UPI0008985B68|nr:carbohydrate ABC transporter permease [Paenibacillus sp. CF384]SDW85467.1 raffinose/stachyose/melibiose transport system permease protein [Paenibacillus sp. CF384]